MRLLLVLALAGCAPAHLERIHSEVGSRITYQNYAAKDWRIVEAGETAKGNCAVFAMTYKWELLRAGEPAEVVLCRTPSGEGHAYTRSGEWVLDNRFNGVVAMSQQDCK